MDMMDELSDLEFDAWLGALERGEKPPDTLSADDVADLSLARRLLALREKPSPALAARVAGMPAAALATTPPTENVPRRRSALVGAAIIAGLALVFSLVFTPAGTWAQGVLHQFGITFLPGVMPQWGADLPEITPTRSPVAFSSEREVQAAAEFPLRWPTEFPFDRGNVTFLGFLAYTQDGAWIESLYGDEEQRYLEVQVFWQRRPGPWPVGEAQFEAISVAGHQGMWGQGVPASFIAGARSTLIHKELNGTETRVGSAEGSVLQPINVLLWEDGKILYVLVDPNQRFSQTDLLQTAESAYSDH
jgi:hypothetical protein